MPPMKDTAFTTFPTSPLNHASAARRGWPHSSPPRPTTGPSRSSVARRSIVGRATRTGIDENVPAGVVTFSNSPEWSISRIGTVTLKLRQNPNESFGPSKRHAIIAWIVALLDTFQVSFSSIGKDQMLRAGSYVVWTVAVYDVLNQPRAVQSALWTARGWFNTSYTATVQTTYEPALNIWSFPIEENETWNVSSNATIHAMIAWRFDGPNDSFGFWHNFKVTVPIRLTLDSGELENVTTPAGTFASIPVRVALPTIDRLATDDREGPVVGLGGDECGQPRLAAEAWFSGDVGNAVKAVSFIGGMKIVAELASFHRA